MNNITPLTQKKVEPNQSVDRYFGPSLDGYDPEDALHQEFSDTLDKIASRLKASSHTDFSSLVPALASPVVPRLVESARRVTSGGERETPSDTKESDEGAVVAAPSQGQGGGAGSNGATSQPSSVGSQGSSEDPRSKVDSHEGARAKEPEKGDGEVAEEAQGDSAQQAIRAVADSGDKTGTQADGLAVAESIKESEEIIAQPVPVAPTGVAPLASAKSDESAHVETAPKSAAARVGEPTEMLQRSVGKEASAAANEIEVPVDAPRDVAEQVLQTLRSLDRAVKASVTEMAEKQLPTQSKGAENGADALLAATILRHVLEAPQVTARVAQPAIAGGVAQAIAPQAVSASLRSSEGGARQETAKSAPRPMPRAQESRMMEKVENALKEVARSKDGRTISVRLDPPSLGTLKVDVSLRDGALHARVVAESAQVASLLQEKAHELVTTLRKAGIEVEKITVSTGTLDGELRSTAGDSSGTRREGSKRGQGTGPQRDVADQDGSATLKATAAMESGWVA